MFLILTSTSKVKSEALAEAIFENQSLKWKPEDNRSFRLAYFSSEFTFPKSQRPEQPLVIPKENEDNLKDSALERIEVLEELYRKDPNQILDNLIEISFNPKLYPTTIYCRKPYQTNDLPKTIIQNYREFDKVKEGDFHWISVESGLRLDKSLKDMVDFQVYDRQRNHLFQFRKPQITVIEDIKSPKSDQEKKVKTLFEKYYQLDIFQSKSFGDYLEDKLGWSSKDWYRRLERNKDKLSRTDTLNQSFSEILPHLNLYKMIKFDSNFKKGVNFWDICPIFSDYRNLQEFKKYLPQLLESDCQNFNPTKIVGLESRGLWLSPYFSDYYQVGWVPVRKPKKLPNKVYNVKYQKEYGFDELEIQADALTSDDKVLIVDDLLATGGSLKACQEVIKQTGAKIIGALILGRIPIEMVHQFDFPVLIFLNPIEYKNNHE